MPYQYLICVDGYHSDNDKKSDAEKYTSDCSDPENAAREYVEIEHGAMDSPSEIDIVVWDQNDEKTKWRITAEPDIVFYSSEIT